MRFLITGGAGFIGSHLADELLARGDRVHVLDDLSTGSMDNIAHLKGHEGFDYTIDSAAKEPLVAELVDEADVVYHLAAAVGVELIVESPVRAIETNVHCTEVLLAQASKKKKPVLVASTSEVYGKSAALPFTEDGDLVLGIDRHRALGLRLLEGGRRVPRDRLLEGAGPADGGGPAVQHGRTQQTGRYGMVIPRLVRQALAGEPLTVHGDGNQRRCFCHVGDVVVAARRPDDARRRLRRGLQRRQQRGDHDPRAGGADRRADGVGVGDQP